MATSGPRRGITLIEVLIAIGILAVGLTSVVALVPAGQSQAARAVILDRAAVALANGLQDAVTYGLTRPESVSIDSRDLFPTVPQVGTRPTIVGQVLIFDPVLQSTGVAANTIFPNAAGAMIRRAGIYSQSTDPAATWPVLQLIGQGRDDIVVKAAAGPDDPPLNAFDSNNLRMFNGRMTCLFSLARADNVRTDQMAAGDLARLTVVAFHNRDLTDPGAGIVTAKFNGERLYDFSALPSGRTLKEIIRPGVVIYDPNKTNASDATNNTAQYLRWSQVQMASVDSTDNSVYVTFSSPKPRAFNAFLAPWQLVILLDSVGMAEQMVVLEGSGLYLK